MTDGTAEARPLPRLRRIPAVGTFEFFAGVTPTPTPTPALPGDVWADGRVDRLDVFELARQWHAEGVAGETIPKDDLDYNDAVDATDLLQLIEEVK